MGNLHLHASSGITTEHFYYSGSSSSARAALTGFAARLSLSSCSDGSNSHCTGGYTRFAVESSNVWSVSAGFIGQERLSSRFTLYGFFGARLNSLLLSGERQPMFIPFPSFEAGGGLTFSLHRFISLYAEAGVTATLPYGFLAGGGLRFNL